MCELLCTEDALTLAARELSLLYGRDGVTYSEIYVSPYIYERWGLSWSDSMGAVDAGFHAGEELSGARITILLDSVRQWGVEAATRVLDAYEEHRWPRVVGFGLGGEESVPLDEFSAVYERARGLGLATVVHAGETGPASDVATAIEVLGVDRIAHGVRAIEDREVLSILRSANVPLDLAITSNYVTGVVAREERHPVRELVDAGVTVSFGCDDPAIFGTTPSLELEAAARLGALSWEEIEAIVANAPTLAFTDQNRERTDD